MAPDLVPNKSDSPESLYKPKLLLGGGIIELLEKSPRGDVYGYGATPLDNVNNLEQQSTAFRRLRLFAQYRPGSVPEEIGLYVSETFQARFFGRAEANDENFTTRIVQDYETKVDSIFMDVIDRAKSGHASPAELMLVRDLLGIRGIELACLTHPYGHVKGFYTDMTELLTEMREAVKYGVVLFGGESNDPPDDVRFKVKEIIGDTDESLLIDGKSPGLLMTRKRRLGTLPDGTIIRERSSFVLRTDPDSKLYKMIGPEKIKELQAIQALPGPEQQLALEEFESKISVLLDMNEFKEAIPVSSTVYAFNKETKAEVMRLQELRGQQDQDFFTKHNPPVEKKEPVSEADIAERRALLARVVENAQIYGKFTKNELPPFD